MTVHSPAAADPSSDPLLAVEGLTVSVSGTPVVDGVSFRIASGEILGLVGESGSGKTATGRAILGLLPPGLVRTAGAIRLDGEDLTRVTPSRLRELRGGAVGMVFQEPMVSLNPAMTIGAQLGEALALHSRLDAAQQREACLAMLRRVRIADPEGCLKAYPHEFSGGMRQRIMLAAVMLPKPRLLIADEPTTALDNLAQADVLDLMVELARDSGTAVLLVTHNLGLVARYANRAVVTQRGKVVEEGPARTLLSAPRERYTQLLVAAMPRRGPRPARNAGEMLLEARGLVVEYPGRARLFRRGLAHRAVKGVDLAIRQGETVALVGGSGSGKTTLGRAMLRLVEPTGGQLLFRGQDVTTGRRDPVRAFRLACQIVFQDPFSSLDPRQRIGDIVAEPLRHERGLTGAQRAARVAETFRSVGLTDMDSRFPHQLSGGQRQRVAIARAMVRRPALVVADEPVSALDMTVQKQILTLIRNLQEERGFACLFISHDLGAVAEVADRVLVMQDGLIVEEGRRDAVFDTPRHPYTRALLGRDAEDRAVKEGAATQLHRTLALDIVDLLKERGAAPGERLSRAALAEALDVSRTPINGAVSVLEDLGVVATEGRSVRLVGLDALDPESLRPDGEGGVAAVLVQIARGRLDGSIPDEVSERQLAQQLGVWRQTVVRALAQLAEAGVTTRNRGHGWRFTADFRDLEERAASYRFRMMIEPAALVEPNFALPDGFATRMRREHERFLDRPWEAHDAVAFYEVNAQFHLGLAEASGNRFIAAAVALQNRVRTLSNLSFRVGAARVPVNTREHLAILDAVVAGDRQHAADLMRLHLAGAMNLRPVTNG